VKVLFGGPGGAPEDANIEVRGADTVISSSTIMFAESTGIYVRDGADLTVSLSSVSANGGSGIDVSQAKVRVQVNSILEGNALVGLKISLGNWTGPASSVWNSTITNNFQHGVLLLIQNTADANWPTGEFNNIFGNHHPSSDEQLFTDNGPTEASWRNNYWGPFPVGVPCWAANSFMNYSPLDVRNGLGYANKFFFSQVISLVPLWGRLLSKAVPIAPIAGDWDATSDDTLLIPFGFPPHLTTDACQADEVKNIPPALEEWDNTQLFG
jgi:hypothetical protein